MNKTSRAGALPVLGSAEAMAHDYLLTSAWGDRAGPLGGRSSEPVHREITPRKISGRSIKSPSATDASAGDSGKRSPADVRPRLQ
mgnify:CR=1 FL=1